MDLEVERLFNLPVFDEKNHKFLGYVLDVILDKERTNILGLVIRTRIVRPQKAFPFSALTGFGEGHLLVDESQLRWLPFHKHLWRARKDMRKSRTFIAVRDDETVGKVVDFIANDTGKITTLRVARNLLSKLQDIPYSDVDHLEENCFFLKEKTEEKGLVERTENRSLFEGFMVGAARGLAAASAKTKAAVSSAQRKALIGKIAPEDVHDSQGNVIVRSGEPLTDELLKKIAAEKRLGGLSAAVTGSSIGSRIKRARRRKRIR